MFYNLLWYIRVFVFFFRGRHVDAYFWRPFFHIRSDKFLRVKIFILHFRTFPFFHIINRHFWAPIKKSGGGSIYRDHILKIGAERTGFWGGGIGVESTFTWFDVSNINFITHVICEHWRLPGLSQLGERYSWTSPAWLDCARQAGAVRGKTQQVPSQPRHWMRLSILCAVRLWACPSRSACSTPWLRFHARRMTCLIK